MLWSWLVTNYATSKISHNNLATDFRLQKHANALQCWAKAENIWL